MLPAESATTAAKGFQPRADAWNTCSTLKADAVSPDTALVDEGEIGR
jgi:hypothetical protein